MKLLYSPYSPFVRKVLIVAHEVGVYDKIELIPTHVHVVQPNHDILALNPLGQIPTLVKSDGAALADSTVICAYLNDLGNKSMYPAEPARYWKALFDEAMADGLAQAALTLRYETHVRPVEYRWQDWVDAHVNKIHTALGAFEEASTQFGQRIDIGLAALMATLSYIDLRFPQIQWRTHAPSLADWHAHMQERPSIRALPQT